MAAKKATKKTPPPPEVRVVEAAMALAAVQGWRDTTMMDIAEGAGLTLVEMRGLFASKTAILAGLIRQTDDIILRDDDGDMAGEPVRDRLFDVIMRRLDALAPYRAGGRTGPAIPAMDVGSRAHSTLGPGGTAATKGPGPGLSQCVSGLAQ
jgi:AcrR family transcriptional regulator